MISTPARGYEVERRNSAFTELRRILTKLHPGFVAPRLPTREIKKLDPEPMEKRRQKLQHFLDEVLRHPVLRCSSLLMHFLSDKSEDAYDRFRKGADKTPRPKEVGNFCTLDGNARVTYDSYLTHDCAEVQQAVEKIKATFEEYGQEASFATIRLKALNVELSMDLFRVGKTTARISRAHRQIAELYGKAVGGPVMSEIFGTLDQVFSSLSKTCKRLEGAYLENFDKYFKDHKRELSAMEEIIKKWRKWEKRYEESEKKLQERKDSLFNLQQLDKWELSDKCPYPIEVLLKKKEIATAQMLPKDTAALTGIREVYGYFSNKVMEEFRRICHKSEGDICDHMTEVSHMYCEIFDTVLPILQQ